LEIDNVTQGVEVEGYIRSREWVEKREDLFTERIKPREYDWKFINDFPLEIAKLFVPEFDGRSEEQIEALRTKIFKEPHYDTGSCTEIDTLPFDNLGDLSDNLKEVIGLVYEYCISKNWLYMLMGVTPVSGYGGGHIHCSINPDFDETSLSEGPEIIYNKLYPYQVFVSLLGQNSSYKATENISVASSDRNSYSRRIYVYGLSDVKDTRIQDR